jgi:hypothetical protein
MTRRTDRLRRLLVLVAVLGFLCSIALLMAQLLAADPGAPPQHGLLTVHGQAWARAV